jgi:2-hydroxy-4-carboxymuconate semialdehyde hemiacetal dehydrogenase
VAAERELDSGWRVVGSDGGDPPSLLGHGTLRRVRLGFVGYGSIARQHARALRGLWDARIAPDLRLSGVMGRVEASAAEFAAEFGLGLATTDLGQLLDQPELDGVVICSPTDRHAEQTELALRAGKHVLCEIPLATSLGEVDRLIALADQLGRRLMVCHTERYYTALLEVRRRIASGALHPHAIVSRYMFQRRENVNWVGRRRSWTDNLLWHHGCHAVDAALWMLGADQADVVAEVALPGANLGIPMDLAIAMRTPRDQIVSVSMSYNTHLPLHDYLVIGEETTLLFSDGELRSKDSVLVPRQDLRDLTEPIRDQDAEFLAAVREQREPAVSGRAVRPAMAALQAVDDTLHARLASLGADARHPHLP